MKKLSSLTIFFPFYNDAGTVQKMIADAYRYGRKATNDLEVIVIHGGDSKDETLSQILKAKKEFPKLKVINKSNNTLGYAVIKYGFAHATKAWIFYTDGDGQYDVKDLSKLVLAQIKTGADVVNGYKKNRQDSQVRVFFGEVYRRITHILFNLPINDIDCDFRLIRKKLLSEITFHSEGGSIVLELIISLKHKGATFTQVPVYHYPRVYGTSNYSIIRLAGEKLKGDFLLFLRMRKVPFVKK